MTPRRLAAIAILALAAVIAAFWLAGERTGQSTSAARALYPELEAALAEAQQVTIHAAGDATVVTLERDVDRWRVVERAGYSADTAELRQLVRSLAEARIVEEKTTRPENYAALGVQDLENTEATGTRVVIDGTDVDLIIGERATGRTGTYVRPAGEAQSLLVDQTFEAPREPGEWIEPAVIDVGADRIQSATITVGDATYTAAKASRADADFAVDGVPADRELTSAGAANSVATALARLEADDVRPASELAEIEPATRATYRTFDGLELELTGYTHDDRNYVTVAPRTTESTAGTEAGDADTAAAPDEVTSAAAEDERGAQADAEADAAAEDEATVAEEALEIATRTGGWAYAIPEYKYDAIFRPLEELLQPQSEE